MEEEKTNVVKMPDRSEDGILERLSEALELTRNKEIKDFMLIYNTYEGERSIYWAVIDDEKMIGLMEKAKFELQMAALEDDHNIGDE